MSPNELIKVIEYCEDRWPGTRNYRAVEKAAWDFAAIPAEAVHQAAQNHFAAGERSAPTLSQLRAEGARIAAQRGLTDPQGTDCDVRKHHGAWALDWARDSHGRTKTDDAGHPLREAMCVDCGTTVIRPANQLLTVGEHEAQREAGQEPQGPTLTDIVAP
jgi:hypothetical protein